MNQKFLVFFILANFAVQQQDDVPNQNHIEELNKILELKGKKSFDKKEASLIFFQAYTQVTEEILKEMEDRNIQKEDEGFFEHMIMLKSYEGIKDFFNQKEKEVFTDDELRNIIEKEDILRFLLPYLSDIYKQHGEFKTDNNDDEFKITEDL